jgi:hypothetical protein
MHMSGYSYSTSGIKTSAYATAALMITALMAWSVDAYVGHLHGSGSPSSYLAQVDPGTPVSDRDTANG